MIPSVPDVLCQSFGRIDLVSSVGTDSCAAKFDAVGAGVNSFADIFYQSTDIGAAADIADGFYVGVFVRD